MVRGLLLPLLLLPSMYGGSYRFSIAAISGYDRKTLGTRGCYNQKAVTTTVGDNRCQVLTTGGNNRVA